MKKARLGLVSLAAIAALLFACGREPARDVTTEKLTPSVIRPAVGWDSAPRGEIWTETVLAALNSHGNALPKMVPEDIDAYCPGYREATEAERKAFWVALLSALSKHESTWRPAVSGGDGRWHGLLQIAPSTARGYQCKAQTAEELKNGAANLSCGIRIMSVTVLRDGVISEGMRGVAADWGPFHQSRKRRDIQQRTQAQPFC